MYNFDNVVAAEEFISKYILPGITEVTITGIGCGKSSSKGTEFIKVEVKERVGEKTCENSYYFKGDSDKVTEISKGALLSIGSAAIGEENCKNAARTATSLEDLANKLNMALVGKSLRMRFGGEEVLPQDTNKKIWVKTVFSTGLFCESISVSKEASKLKYDESKAIKRLPVTATTVVTANVGQKADW